MPRGAKPGPEHPNWKGGRVIREDGRVYITAGLGGRPRLEHVLIAERALGKRLPKRAQVHHANGDPGDNRNANLVICQDQRYHQLLHQRQRALDATGDPNAHRCVFCGGYGRQSDMTLQPRTNGHVRAYHRECNTEYHRAYRARYATQEAQ